MYSIETKMSKYIHSEEIFNADNLAYIINNYEKLKDKKWDSSRRATNIDPLILAKKYLNRSRNGTIPVKYRQREGKGRFCAVGSVSLQNMPKAIRHSIANQYYIDIDVKNAHPIFLLHECKIHNYPYTYLEEYIHNREKYLQELTFNGISDRDQAKDVYLSLMNGGTECLSTIDKKTEHLKKFHEEMKIIHNCVASTNDEEYKKVVKNREKKGQTYNHKAGYMNTILCDMENNILMDMYEFFGKPDNVVYCFDGLMLPCCKDNDPKNYGSITYDIEGCQKYIQNKYKMPLFELCIKDMDQGYNCLYLEEIPKYIYPTFETYSDYKYLIDDVYKEFVDEYISKCIKLVDNGGNQVFLTRVRDKINSSSLNIKYTYAYTKKEKLLSSLEIKCNIINDEYDAKFAKMYEDLSKPEQKKYMKTYKLTKEQIQKNIQKYSYTKLYSKKEKEGYFNHILENRLLETYSDVVYEPYLIRNGIPRNIGNSFNLFEGFTYELLNLIPKIQFEETHFYKHLQNEFFNNDEGELNHFLDHIADIIQDPCNIKGITHVFYSPQGCGKGLLTEFMKNLIDKNNVCVINDMERYFKTPFNADTTNKLLKVFEEVSEKGSGYSNHNKLKGEITNCEERVEPKGLDPVRYKHMARYWFYSNNENSLMVESDDRRHTMHKINGRYAQNQKYFKPIIEEIRNENFMKCAFEYFATREYEIDNVTKTYDTKYKKDQKLACLSSGIKFIIYLIQKKVKIIKDETKYFKINEMKEAYREYCESNGQKYNAQTLATQIKGIIDEPKRVVINYEEGKKRKLCYKINSYKIQQNIQERLRDDTYTIIKTDELQEIDEVNML